MDSLEWRLRKLENTIYGHSSNRLPIFEMPDQENSISDHLENVAKDYKNFMSVHGEKYTKFVELYAKQSLLDKLNCEISDTSKAELILAYEEELVRHLETYKLMAEKSNQVLNIESWPDPSVHEKRLEDLQNITREHHLQALSIDKETENLIGIYNEILGSLKNNMSLWNQKLELFEDQEKKSDEDVA